MKINIFWLLAGLLLVSGCTDSPALQYIEGFAQGTTYHIRYWSGVPLEREKIIRAVSGELSRIDADMSSYRTDSTLERFNKRHDMEPQWVGTGIVQLVRQALAVNRASGGCYDLSIKPLFELWGFQEGQFSVPEIKAIHDVLQTVGMHKLAVVDDSHLRKTDPLIQVDLSSIAQGYTVGRIARVLESHGVHDYLVEIGGELLVKGKKPGGQAWRVAIEKPLPGERSVEKIITIEASSPLAVMTSGTYRHFYDQEGVRYSHILDARSGYPVTHATVSVTVLYQDAALADAWSTALLCLGKESGVDVANQQGIPALFIEQIATEQGSVKFREIRSEPLRQLQGIRIE